MCPSSLSRILHSCTLPLEEGSVTEASVHALSRPSPQHWDYGHAPQCLACCTFSGSGFRSRCLCSRHFGNQASPQPLLDNLASRVTACWWRGNTGTSWQEEDHGIPHSVFTSLDFIHIPYHVFQKYQPNPQSHGGLHTEDHLFSVCTTVCRS